MDKSYQDILFFVKPSLKLQLIANFTLDQYVLYSKVTNTKFEILEKYGCWYVMKSSKLFQIYSSEFKPITWFLMNLEPLLL